LEYVSERSPSRIAVFLGVRLADAKMPSAIVIEREEC
jgi:hypothetical protein